MWEYKTSRADDSIFKLKGGIMQANYNHRTDNPDYTKNLEQAKTDEKEKALDFLPIEPPSEYYEVLIRKVANGFVLRIGCKEFVAKNWEEAATGIGEYWKDPRAAQKNYSN